ncbi:NUMOD4 domain-containing protein [Leuconostoc citreum]
MEYESWKDIVGFQNVYQVSNHGNIRSIARVLTDGRVTAGKYIKGSSNGNGYLYVTLSYGNIRKHKYIHRLVAETFLKNDEKLLEVNHIDGDKTNNSIENLEWVNSKQNKHHALVNGLYDANSYKFENEIVADLLRGHHRNYVAEKYKTAIVSIDRIIERRNIANSVYKPNRANNINKYIKRLNENDLKMLINIKKHKSLSNDRLATMIGISSSTVSALISKERSGCRAETYDKLKKFIEINKASTISMA